jgi:hypothetical protein
MPGLTISQSGFLNSKSVRLKKNLHLEQRASGPFISPGYMLLPGTCYFQLILGEKKKAEVEESCNCSSTGNAVSN